VAMDLSYLGSAVALQYVLHSEIETDSLQKKIYLPLLKLSVNSRGEVLEFDNIIHKMKILNYIDLHGEEVSLIKEIADQKWHLQKPLSSEDRIAIQENIANLQKKLAAKKWFD
jgi:hypothetical protein